MQIIPKAIAALTRRLEHALCQTSEQKAITDYNIMMGNLEDPAEEEEEETNG